MVVTINGKRYWLWRAVDNEGEVLDFLVQPERNTKSAKKLLNKLLKRQGFAPTKVVTDKFRSYSAEIRSLGLKATHDRGLRANNRAENSHQPVRRRERKQQGFKSPGSAQRSLAVHAATYNTFNHQRHLLSRASCKVLRTGSYDAWPSRLPRTDLSVHPRSYDHFPLS
jgi:putative transposase